MTETTLTAGKGWAPDVKGFVASEVLPGLLITEITTVAGAVEGDEVALRVPYVGDVATELIAEGAPLTEQDASLHEVVVNTHKVGSLVVLSNELARNSGEGILADGLSRNVVIGANNALLNHASAPTGILHNANITDGGALGDNLDAVSNAIWGIVEAGGTADYILAAPSAMGALSTLKAGTGSNQSLVTEPVLYGLNVHVTNAMPADTILVGSRSAVVSAVGPVLLAKSSEYAFDRDARAVRVTFRSGWTVTNGDRLVKISTAAA